MPQCRGYEITINQLLLVTGIQHKTGKSMEQASLASYTLPGGLYFHQFFSDCMPFFPV
jgi:hypothetical protein